MLGFCAHVVNLHFSLSRCGKLEEMVGLIDTYSSLSASHIEGIDLMNNRFQLLVITMKKKPYNFLDQRTSDFDVDLEEFKRQSHEILVRNWKSHPRESYNAVVVVIDPSSGQV